MFGTNFHQTLLTYLLTSTFWSSNNNAAAFTRSIPSSRHDYRYKNPDAPIPFTRIFSTASPPAPPIYTGPYLPLTPPTENENSLSPPELPVVDVTAALQLAELGLDLALAPSAVSPGLGLYLRLSDGVDSVALPECTLLSGYAKSGTFAEKDTGDKTVGFFLRDATTAVFYERELMSIGDALERAAVECGGGSCGLAGHDLFTEEDAGDLRIVPTDGGDGFARYFVPELVNSEDGVTEKDFTVQNFGQFCNDLGWSSVSPPVTAEEYADRSMTNNCVQLVWRMEYDDNSKCLVPSWPVSVLARDVSFENQDFMELGTRYGWGYWQATVDVNDL